MKRMETVKAVWLKLRNLRFVMFIFPIMFSHPSAGDLFSALFQKPAALERATIRKARDGSPPLRAAQISPYRGAYFTLLPSWNSVLTFLFVAIWASRRSTSGRPRRSSTKDSRHICPQAVIKLAEGVGVEGCTGEQQQLLWPWLRERSELPCCQQRSKENPKR